MKDRRIKKDISSENIIFIFIFFGFFTLVARVMGLGNMLSTLMNTAYDLLIGTCFYIMAISVLAGALAGIFSEFGFIALIDRLLSKVMGPIYNLPGAASLGVLNTYLSDNPAILTLADDKNFKSYFELYQIPALCNLGTSFGMGLIVTSTMMALPIEGAGKSALIGNLGAIVGSIFSVRIMIHFTKMTYGKDAWAVSQDFEKRPKNTRLVRKGSPATRFMEALLEGGKSGVDTGLLIIPGVVCICTLVMLLTNGPGPGGNYTGDLGQGVAVLPWLGDKLSFILVPLFGFSSSASISVPITALGSAGAAIGLVGNMASAQALTGNDLAVFTAMCMCWSGYLSTHIAMMDSLNCREVTGYAIISHTIGGLAAGAFAHIFYMILA